jgi:hypothetical protein
MASFFFKKFMSFFKNVILGEIFQSNQHLLILDRHGSHVTLEAISQAQAFGLNMVILLTFHVLQPLDVSCFKPFKIAFKKEQDNAMVKNNHCELEKCTLTRRVDKSLD